MYATTSPKNVNRAGIVLLVLIRLQGHPKCMHFTVSCRTVGASQEPVGPGRMCYSFFRLFRLLLRLLRRYHYRDTSMLNKLGNNVHDHVSQYSPKLVSRLPLACWFSRSNRVRVFRVSTEGERDGVGSFSLYIVGVSVSARSLVRRIRSKRQALEFVAFTRVPECAGTWV